MTRHDLQGRTLGLGAALAANAADRDRSAAGRWHVTLSTRDGDVTITAPNAISTEAMREAMRAYWGEKT